MPELPEVETVARTLAPHISHNKILAASLIRPSSLHPNSLPLSTLVGCEIQTVRRRGKLLLLDLMPQTETGPTLLAAHLRMTGSFLVHGENEQPGKHTRCIFSLENTNSEKKQLFFEDIRAFGQLFAGSQKQLELWPFWQKLGPEPLEMSPNELFERLKGTRPIKSALLDQTVLAGIGNIYADEALFKAGILPGRPARDITENESAILMASIQEILLKAIEKRGSSIRDYKDANGQSGSFQKGFYVYGRGGKTCKKCGQTLIRKKIGGRSSVYCPNCQK